ncbi:Fe-S oxidoreductase [Leucobacter sp. USCH14]|uniref:Fe-S oxidoreductase n=1 Tax=Leucobacter sp. USCH14 TaxID=3024838 RepID=UPI003094A92A
MRLGARWQTGAPPHRSVPEELHAAIAEQEALHPAAQSWTLTWLEGRPRCVLDDVAFVALDVVGRVRTGPVRHDEEVADAARGRDAVGGDAPAADDDDDEWLS